MLKPSCASEIRGPSAPLQFVPLQACLHEKSSFDSTASTLLTVFQTCLQQKNPERSAAGDAPPVTIVLNLEFSSQQAPGLAAA
jgi:hypothetical protein